MISDDERREVARRLREIEQGVTGAFIPTKELAESILRAIDYGRSGAMTPYGCLADLIEPSCDRDALLALADKIVKDTEEDMDSRAGLVPAYIAGQCLRDVAKCIRDALGVSE